MASIAETGPRRRSARQRLWLAVGIVVTVGCVLAAGGVGYGYWRYAQITRYDVDLPPAAAGEPQNFLIVGSDSRANLDPSDADYGAFIDGISSTGGQRTDTIMILRVDPDEEKADLLSLPRDLYVPIGTLDGPKSRINTAYAEGRQVLINTIQNNFGIEINHYVEIDFQGFKGLVTAIGGVPIYFDEPVRDENTGLNLSRTGCLTLKPKDALAFVRSRHLEIKRDGRWVTDPSGDFGRISRQQLFIRRSIKRAIGKGLTNPVTLNELVGVGVDNVGLDPGISVKDLLSFGRRFATFNEETLRTHELTATPFRTSAGASVLDLDEESSEPVLNIFRGLPPGTVSPPFIDVTVLNGGSVVGQAADVAAALQDIGFAIDQVGDASEPFPRTALYYAPGSEHAALRLVGHLSSKAQLVEDPDLCDNELVLVVGPDFTTVHQQPSTEDLSRLLPKKHTTTTGGGAAPTTSTTEPAGYTPPADKAASCV